MDLNRDFPDPLATSNLKVTGREQPETKAVMDWTLATGFVASANMHEVWSYALRSASAALPCTGYASLAAQGHADGQGSVLCAQPLLPLLGNTTPVPPVHVLQGDAVVNYPYDGNVWGTSAENKTQDDAAFRHLALSYSLQNPRMLSNSVRRGVAECRVVTLRASRAELRGRREGAVVFGPRQRDVRAAMALAWCVPHLNCYAALARCRSLTGGLLMGQRGTPSTAACRCELLWLAQH